MKALNARQRYVSIVRDFALNQRGNVSLMFAVMLIPLLSCIGMAVDLGSVYRVRAISQNAIDAATLAAGKAAQTNPSTPMTSATAAATNYFNAAKPTNVLSSTMSTSGGR